MATTDLISREAAVREALGLYRDAQQSVRKCREEEDDFGFLAFSGQKEAFRWMAMVLMALPAAGEDAHAKEPNEPLTIEQLREMDGEPVWVEAVQEKLTYCDGWCVVFVGRGDWSSCALIPGDEDTPWEFMAYGTVWLAYRRPPEGEEDT